MSSNSDNVLPIVEEYARVKMQIKELDAYLKQVEPAVKAAIDDGESIIAGQYVVSAAHVAGRKTLDKAAVESALGNIEPYMKQGAPYVRIEVKKLSA